MRDVPYLGDIRGVEEAGRQDVSYIHSLFRARLPSLPFIFGILPSHAGIADDNYEWCDPSLGRRGKRFQCGMKGCLCRWVQDVGEIFE